MMHGRFWRGVLPALTLALVLPLSSRADENAKPADKPAAKKVLKLAHIKLSGSMEEKAPTVDSLLGSLGETFRDKLVRIKKAGDDKEINGLLLEINGLGVGWGKLNELSKALTAFRATGKKVFAHLEGGSSKDYLLGLACDEVCLPESAWLMLTGVRIEVSFYKDVFEKIGVKADMLHMGDFKGAAEPYTRTSLSEPNRKQLNALLDDFYDHEIVDRIVKARTNKKLTAHDVKKLIDAGPYAARAALKVGLVDRIAYLDGYEEVLKQKYEADSVKVVRDYGKKKEEDLDLAALARKFFLGASKSAAASQAPRWR